MTGEEKTKEESKDGSKCKEEKILVSVRLRPLNQKELDGNDVCDWECIGDNTIAVKANLPERSPFPNTYTFDKVFGIDCQTKQVYEEGAKEVILSVVSGINATVFAYGQTSSGKTYTMNGLTEYAVGDIYGYIETHKSREFVLRFSAMEIYNEAVKDLLCPDDIDSPPLRLLDDPEGTVVEKLTEQVLRDRNHLLELLSICAAQRKVGETSLNETSSRSHQILRLTVESSARDFRGVGSSSALAATVNFVDLAGSERASQAFSTGMRLKEGSHINRSLLTLGTVIRKLSKGKNGHVPYRDSKLTRILQNSLGGNARTAVICTLSPAHSQVEQSRNVLVFASCAKEVTTNAKVNVVVSDKVLVKQLKRELAKMENELRGLTSKHVSYDSANLLKEKELLIEEMEREIKELRKQRDLAESRIESLLGSVRLDRISKPEVMERTRADKVSKTNFHEHSQYYSQTSNNIYLMDNGTPKYDGLELSLVADDLPEETRAEPEDDCEVSYFGTEQKRETAIVLYNQENKDVNSEGSELSRDNEEKELSDSSSVAQESTYEALKQKIRDMQKTIDCLVHLYPQDETPYSYEPGMSSSRNLRISKSRSCRAVLTTAPSIWLKHNERYENTYFAGSEMDSSGSSQTFWCQTPQSNHGVHIGNLSRKDSCSSTMSTSFETDVQKELDLEAETPGKVSPAASRSKSPANYIRKLFRNDSRASVLSSLMWTEKTKEVDIGDIVKDIARGERSVSFMKTEKTKEADIGNIDEDWSRGEWSLSLVGKEKTKEVDTGNIDEDLSRGERGLRRKLLKERFIAFMERLSRKYSHVSVLSAPPDRYGFKDSNSDDNISVLSFNVEQTQTAEYSFRNMAEESKGKTQRGDAESVTVQANSRLSSPRKESPAISRAKSPALSTPKLLRNNSRAFMSSSLIGTARTKEIGIGNIVEDLSGGEQGLRQKLFKEKFGAYSEKLSRKHSNVSVLCAPPDRYDFRDSDSDDSLSVLSFNEEQKQMAKNSYLNLEDESESEKHTKNMESIKVQANPSFPFEFEKRRQEIIELWDSCRVPLVHRTYFFLLFKGEPSDSVYYEVELRRLSFLREKFSQGDIVKKASTIPTPATSLNILNREREMLSRQMHRKFSRKERESLYQKWRILLTTKRRSLQLVRRLWTNTRDLEHLRESAVLVAKLVGFVEVGQVPKETFGLSFTPQPSSKKAFVWKYRRSSLS